MTVGRPLRILYVSHSFPLPDQPLSNVGGMQSVAVALHDALRDLPGVELHSRVLETSWEQTGIRMVPYMAGLLRDLPAQVRRDEIDVVLFSSMVTASCTLLLRRRLRDAGALTAAIPVGRDVTLPNPIYQRLVPKILRSLDLVLPISGATASECLARGLAPEKMHIVPCGVALEKFAVSEPRKLERRALLDSLRAAGRSIPDDALLLFSVGRHQERKGFHWFAGRVMPLLPPDVIFLLGGEGPMTDAIRETAERHEVADRVHMLGRLSDDSLLACYRGADLFVMPNIPVAGDIEGFGVVMLEAGASGLPVIAADLEGIRDVVTPGENGELIASGDVAGFADAILRFHAETGLLAAASARAAEHTASRFGWTSIAQTHLEILRSARAGASEASEARGRPA
jgi:phosphatidyl-myo-inositol dimannoside synthase